VQLQLCDVGLIILGYDSKEVDDPLWSVEDKSRVLVQENDSLSMDLLADKYESRKRGCPVGSQAVNAVLVAVLSVHAKRHWQYFLWLWLILEDRAISVDSSEAQFDCPWSFDGELGSFGSDFDAKLLLEIVVVDEVSQLAG
jgi:hypothetical protein